MPTWTGEGRFAPLAELLARHSLAQEWQGLLWQTYLGGSTGPGSGISAFPSLHLANATLFVLLTSQVSRWLMWPAVVFCAVIMFGSVQLGWHYAIDGYFSIVATVLIWRAVGWALQPRVRQAFIDLNQMPR